MENFLLEFRASRASPLMTFPKFDGSGALAWLARANQYFLVNNTPSDRRVDVAMIAIDGPAKPWKQLLVRRCPSLSWDRFVQELLNRFGNTIPSESRVTGNPSKYSSAHINNTKSHNLNTEPTPPLHPTPAQDAAHIKVELIGQRQEDVKTLAPDSQRKYSPPLLADPVLETAPLLPSQEGVKPHAYDSQPQDLVTFSAENKTAVYPAPAAEDSTKPEISSPAPEGQRHPSNPPPPQPLTLPVQHPFLPPVFLTLPSPTRLPIPATLTAPLLSSSPDIPQFQLPFLPLLRHLVPVAAADNAKLMASFTPPTTAMVTTPLLFASLDILRIQSPNYSLLRCLVPAAAHQSTPMVVSFLDSLFSSAGAPFF